MKRKALSFFLGTLITIFFTLSLLEIALRIFPSTQSQTGTDSVDRTRLSTQGPIGDRRQIRILVLGESTSAPNPTDGVDLSWPAQAKSLLQASTPEYEFEIINLAKPGTSTAFLAEELFRRFDELRPDILVSMMGVNDQMALALREPVWWNSIRVIHFFRWLIQFLGCKECFQVESGDAAKHYSPPPESMDRYFQELHSFAAFDSSKIERLTKEFETELIRFRGQPTLQLSALRSLGNELAWLAVRDHKNAPKLRAAASSYFLRALKIDPIDPWTLDSLCQIQTEEDESCLRSVEKMIEAGNSPSSSLLRSVISAGGQSSEVIRQEADRRGLKILDTTPTYEATKTIYQQVAEFAKSRGIPYFAMQYPTGSIDGTRSFFTKNSSHSFKKFSDSFHLQGLAEKIDADFDHVIFVDNSKFNSPEVQANRAAYFTDMFGRDQGLEFGHTTPLGHRLIAESIASAIQKYLAVDLSK